MGKRDKKKVLSVLSRQQPKKRRRSFNRRTLKISGAILLGLSVVAGALVGIKKIPPMQASKKRAPINWTIEMLGLGEKAALPAQTIATSRAVLDRALSKGQSLDEAATAIYSAGHVSSVALRQLPNSRIVLKLEPRIPVFCAQIGSSLRYVSTKGDIYGHPQEESCPKPLLLGLAIKSTSKKDNIIKLDDQSRGVLAQALALWDTLKKKNIAISGFEYQLYRGFVIHINNHQTAVTLGLDRFPEKLERMGNIVEKTTKNGSIAEKIELDYHGKAFIKLRNL